MKNTEIRFLDSVKTKMIVTFIVSGLLLLLSSGAGFITAGKFVGMVNLLTGPAWDAANGAMETSIGVNQQLYLIEKLTHTDISDKTLQEKLKTKLQQSIIDADKSIKEAKDSGQFSEAEVNNITAIYKKYSDSRNILMKDIKNKDFQKNYEESTENLYTLMEKLNEMGDSKIESQIQVGKDLALKADAFLLVVFLVGLGVLITSYVAIQINLIKPLQLLSKHLQGIADEKAQGDLTVSLETKAKGEMLLIASSFNLFNGKLRQIIKDFMKEMRGIKDSANDLSTATGNTYKAIHAQNDEINMIFNAVREISQAIENIALSAQETAESTQFANDQAVHGQDIVQKAVNQINLLSSEIQNASSVIQELDGETQNIQSILLSIGEITEQTNLLALNAAIEAARAGESGKGFAVVADEVRALANRTQEATNQSRKMLEQFQNTARHAVDVMLQSKNLAEESVVRASEAGTALNDITESVANISDMNMRVASSAEEQATVAKEIQSAIEHIIELTQNISGSADITKSNSDDLSRLADNLYKIVHRFKV